MDLDEFTHITLAVLEEEGAATMRPPSSLAKASR